MKILSSCRPNTSTLDSVICRFILSLINIRSVISYCFITLAQQNPSPGSNQWSASAVTRRLLRADGENHIARQCGSIRAPSSEPQLILGNHLCVHSHLLTSKTPLFFQTLLPFYSSLLSSKVSPFCVFQKKRVHPTGSHPASCIPTYCLSITMPAVCGLLLSYHNQPKVFSCQRPVFLLCIPSPPASSKPWSHK